MTACIFLTHLGTFLIFLRPLVILTAYLYRATISLSINSMLDLPSHALSLGHHGLLSQPCRRITQRSAAFGLWIIP